MQAARPGCTALISIKATAMQPSPRPSEDRWGRLIAPENAPCGDGGLARLGAGSESRKLRRGCSHERVGWGSCMEGGSGTLVGGNDSAPRGSHHPPGGRDVARPTQCPWPGHIRAQKSLACGMALSSARACGQAGAALAPSSVLHGDKRVCGGGDAVVAARTQCRARRGPTRRVIDGLQWAAVGGSCGRAGAEWRAAGGGSDSVTRAFAFSPHSARRGSRGLASDWLRKPGPSRQRLAHHRHRPPTRAAPPSPASAIEDPRTRAPARPGLVRLGLARLPRVEISRPFGIWGKLCWWCSPSALSPRALTLLQRPPDWVARAPASSDRPNVSAAPAWRWQPPSQNRGVIGAAPPTLGAPPQPAWPARSRREEACVRSRRPSASAASQPARRI